MMYLYMALDTVSLNRNISHRELNSIGMDNIIYARSGFKPWPPQKKKKKQKQNYKDFLFLENTKLVKKKMK